MATMEYLKSEQVFDKIHREYDAAYGVEYPGFADVLQRLKGMLPAKAVLLDVGCGTARLPSQLFSGQGYHYLGVDISQEMVHQAHTNMPDGMFVKADLLDYIPDQPVDALIAAHVFYQVPYQEIKSYLSAASGWLQPHGIFLFCIVPGEKREPDLSLYHPQLGYIDDKPTTFMGEPTRQTFVTSEGWRTLVESCGFDIVESGEYGYNSKHPKAASEDTLFLIARKRMTTLASARDTPSS